MRVLVAALSAACLTLALGAPAEAADSVTIGTIGTKTAPYKKTVTVKPTYRKSGQVQVRKATLTVKSKGRTIRRDQGAVQLKAGTYTVTQRVLFRSYRKKATKTRVVTAGQSIRSGLSAPPANAPFVDVCWISSSTPVDDTTGTFRVWCDVMRNDGRGTSLGGIIGEGTYAQDADGYVVLTDQSGHRVAEYLGMPTTGEGYQPTGSVRSDRDLFVTTTSTVYGTTRAKTRTQKLTIKQGRKPRGCATYADFRSVEYDFDEPEWYGDTKAVVAKKLHSSGTRTSYSDYGDMVIEFREYKACAKGAFISVGFADGHAYAKSYWG